MARELKGRVYPYYFVQCGICCAEWTLGTTDRERAKMHLRRSGYKHTKEHGYVCSECQKKAGKA